MAKDTPNSVSTSRSDTLMPTTDTMRKKAQFVAKCTVYLLKIWRCIKCNRSTKNNTKAQNKCDKQTQET